MISWNYFLEIFAKAGLAEFLAILMLVGTLIAAIIAIRTFRGTFQPMLSVTMKNQDLVVKNIGNRPARKIKVFENGRQYDNTFLLAKDETKRLKKMYFTRNLKVKYRRSPWSLFYKTQKLKETEPLKDLKAKYSPISSLNIRAGRKRLYRFIKKAAKYNWRHDKIGIYLFDQGSDTSKISIFAKNRKEDPESFYAIFDSQYTELLFELTQILGKPLPNVAATKGRWEFLKSDLRKIGNSLSLKTRDKTKNYDLNVEDAYCNLNSKHTKFPEKFSSGVKFQLIPFTNRGRIEYRELCFIDFINGPRLRVVNSNTYFDLCDKGFISSNSRRDAIISQSTGNLLIGVSIFLKESGVIANYNNNFNDWRLSGKDSEEFLEWVKEKSQLTDYWKPTLKDKFSQILISIISYVYWSFRNPVEKERDFW